MPRGICPRSASGQSVRGDTIKRIFSNYYNPILKQPISDKHHSYHGKQRRGNKNKSMTYSKQDITTFKKVNIALGVVGILIMVFWDIKIGGGILAIAVVGYFAPFKES